MAAAPLQSVTRRFLAKFGVAFAWASLVSVFLGGAVFFRVPRTALDDVRPWHADVRLWLERLELVTYDWRARMLGDISTRSDSVVLLSLDDETIGNARAASDVSLSVRPWPRDLLGAVGTQALREGAGRVVFDLPLVDLSPRLCTGSKEGSDDDAMRRRLDTMPGKTLLSFHPLDRPTRPPERELKPWLIKVGTFESLADTRDALRRVLSARAAAYRTEGSHQYEVWAAAVTEQRARELAPLLEIKPPLTIRQENADDAKREVTSTELLIELAEVEVSGFDVDLLPRARSLEGPVAQLLTSSVAFGSDALARDVDWSVRAVPLLSTWVDDAGTTHVLASTALLAAMQRLDTTALSWSQGRLKLSPTVSLPVDESGHLLIWWEAGDVGRGNRGTLKRSIPLWRLAVNVGDDEAKRGLRHHDNELDGRVAIISDTTGAQVPTPVGRTESAAVLGQAVANLLAGKAIERVDPVMDFWLTAGLAFTGAILAVTFSSLFRRAGWLSMFLVLVLSVVLYAGVARQLFLTQQRWVAMAAPLLALSLTFLASLGYAAAIERSVREFMFRAFGRAVRPEVFRRIERNISLMKPERRDVAVFFSDIEGFTAIAQTAEPKKVVAVLQEYLTLMTDIVGDTHGQLDKYLGDGVMAFWGAPVHIAKPIIAACDAALQMDEKFQKRRAGWEKKVGHQLLFRAGIDFGETLVGEMGTEHRRVYSGIGEPVATAARLEAAAKRYAARVVVTEVVAHAAAEQFVFREIDWLRLPRHAAPAKVFELLGRSGDVPSSTLERIAKIATGLGAYHARHFAEALALFEPFVEQDPVARRYAARCRVYQANPPPETWDGVFDGADVV